MKSQLKIAPQTALADAILEAATAALITHSSKPITERTLSECRETARAVAVAVLATVGGAEGKPGLHPFTTRPSQQILSLADDLDALPPTTA